MMVMSMVMVMMLMVINLRSDNLLSSFLSRYYNDYDDGGVDYDDDDDHLRSENFASWFFMTAEQFRISPPQLSSLPHFTFTRVPSGTS